jgi:tyrosine-protein kinase Etk/Wzc
MHGTSDPGEESRILSQQSVALQDKLADAEHSRSELSSRYLSEHPAMVVANERIRNLQRELSQVQAKRRALAAAEQQMSSLSRDKQATAELNASLLSVRQKLDAMSSSGRTDVRLVDRAEVPYQPVNLGLQARIALACVAGLVAGLIAAVLKDARASARRRPPLPRYDGQFRLV